ncbi:hypothetical protein ACHAWU_006545 [Discostella pseudostelligera]|uniref:Uncharacterized protein n=1 Tax=Discostella pseudostelligera TaxID=259834 RepID=A0ABD3M993_9STRA
MLFSSWLGVLLLIAIQSTEFSLASSLNHIRAVGTMYEIVGVKSRQRQGQSTADDDVMVIPVGGYIDNNDADLEDDEMKSMLGDNKLRISPLEAIGKWYMNQINTHELRTKFISAGILSLVGDMCAQNARRYLDNSASTTWLDKQRLVAMFCEGFLCTGPLLHFVYELYERVLPTHAVVNEDGEIDKSPKAKRKLLFASAAHVLFDNFVMVIVYIAVLMVATAVMEGKTSLIRHELAHDLIPALKVSWKVSIMGYAPMQFLSFHFLPRKLRVLAVNSLDVVWVTVMSYVTHRNRH